MNVNQKLLVFILILGITLGGLWISGISNHNTILFVNDYSDELPYGIRLIGADKVWHITQGSPEIVVAVLDSGLNTSHNDLQNILWNNSIEIPDNGIDDDSNGYIDDTHGWDFVHQNNDPFSLLDSDPPRTSLENHGTHVVGTIAAQMNDFGLIGVAPEVSIMPLRVVNESNYNPDIFVLEAINYAIDNGADIISMSIGIYAEEITNATSYQLVENALERAYTENVLIVAAAGNENGAQPIRPANDDHVIAVGAISENKDLATFSNHGAEIVAPGVSGNSTIPFNGFSTSSGTS
ncbi:MAG: S8 family serine peptidase, partial [Candidatus Kariarchaeaceae archaeon]